MHNTGTGMVGTSTGTVASSGMSTNYNQGITNQHTNMGMTSTDKIGSSIISEKSSHSTHIN